MDSLHSFTQILPQKESQEYQNLLIDFENTVSNFARNESETIFPNGGADFSAIVLGKIFENAKYSINIKANIFSGEVSSKTPYLEGLKKAIKNLIYFNIVVSSKETLNTSTSKGLKLLKDHCSKGFGDIYYLQNSNNTPNSKKSFCTADGKMFRYEIDSDHKAYCSFNSKDVAKSLDELFNTLKANSSHFQ